MLCALLATGCVLPPFSQTGPLRCDLAAGQGCAANEVCVNELCVSTVASSDGGLCPPLIQLPAWRASMAVGEWKELNADLQALAATPKPLGGCTSCRIEGWGGFAADTRTSRLYLAAAGGQDYGGNEVYELDLEADDPDWVIVTAPSATSAYTSGDYYSDGKPASGYPYYSTWFIEQRDAVFRFTVTSTWGRADSATIDSWSSLTKTWYPQGTNPRMDSVSPETPTGKDFRTGDVYQLQNSGHLTRWNQASGTLTTLGDVIDYPPFYKSPLVVDAARGRLLVFSDRNKPAGSLSAYDLARSRWSTVAITGPAAIEITKHESQGIGFVDECLGQIVVNTGQADGGISLLDPVSMSSSVMKVSGVLPPVPINGVHTLFQMLPRLGGYAYQPVASRRLFFLATRNP